MIITNKLDSVLQLLRKEFPRFQREFGVQKIGVFGSVAIGEDTKDSDVDIIVEMPPDLSHLIQLKDECEELFQSQVDLIRYRKTMNPYLKKRIEREAVYV